MRIKWMILALAACLSSCGTDVAQTAYLPSDTEAPVDCERVSEELSPPSAPEFGGEAAVTESPLSAGSYGVGEGPGVYVAARDGFRLFVNGELIAQSDSARTPVFIPLTLLPGKNVIGVVVFAEAGIPLAAVEVAELDRSYVSDSTWQVSTSPSADWTEVDGQDPSFAPATDYGTLVELPGCDAGSVFEADSPAHFVGPSEPNPAAALRTEIDITPLGFGADTTGGADSPPVLVEAVEDLVTGLEDETPRVLLLPEGVLDLRPTGSEEQRQDMCPTPCPDGDGTAYTSLVGGEPCDVPLVSRVRNDRRLMVGSNKTLVGLGRGAKLRGASFELADSQNVILRNLAIYDVNRDAIEAGDGIELNSAQGVWIDHCTFKWISDGFTDSRPGTRDVTISWVHYDGLNDLECGGQHTRAVQLSEATATFHHTFFDHNDSRAPLFDSTGALGHLFNNLISDDRDFAVGSYCGAEVLVEGTTFDNVRFPTLKNNCPSTPDLQGKIRAPSGSNLYRDEVGPHRVGSTETDEPHDDVFVPSYSYSVDPPEDAWLDVLERAGAGGPWAQPLTLD